MEIRIDRIMPRGSSRAAKEEAARRLPAKNTKNAHTAEKAVCAEVTEKSEQKETDTG